MPKPLVEVAGLPLIGAVLRNFAAAGITAITIIVNEEEHDCVEWVRERYPDLDVDFIVKTTASSLESFREVTARGPRGRCSSPRWTRGARPETSRGSPRPRRGPTEATVLAVTPLVADEKPLWVTLARGGRVEAIGGRGGRLVTAGVYRVPGARATGRGAAAARAAARVPEVAPPERRAALRGDHRDGGGRGPRPGRGAGGGARARAGRDEHEEERGERADYWGLFREREHSPGRESDDAEILRLTGKHLESHGVPGRAAGARGADRAPETPPDGIFLMCERMEALRVLLAWQERRACRQVNAPRAVLNTYRERMIAQLREANVPFIESRVVATQGPEADSAPRSG